MLTAFLVLKRTEKTLVLLLKHFNKTLKRNTDLKTNKNIYCFNTFFVILQFKYLHLFIVQTIH